jgi:signal transduction histidine kinase
MTNPAKQSSAATVTTPASRSIVLREHRPVAWNTMVLINSQGIIVAVDKNGASIAKTGDCPLHHFELGTNYLEACRREAKSSSIVRAALRGIEGVVNGRSSFTMDYSIRTVSGLRVFRLCVSPFMKPNAEVAITHTDITDLQLAKPKRLQQVTRRLIHAQEDERKRISQELHDDLGSRIALIAFSLREAMKKDRKRSRAAEEKLDKILTDITDLSVALRNLSHHLYPPSLRYAGICAALKTLAAEVEKTHQFKVDLVLPQESPSLPNAVQLCVFRIAQECLQNIVKHSGADRASVRLESTPEAIRLTVSDSGRGFALLEVPQTCGLGLLSMEERAISVGGRLAVQSSPGRGTQVCLTVPIEGNEAFNVDQSNRSSAENPPEF